MTDDYVPFVPPGRRRSGDVSDPIPLAEFVDRTRKLVAPVDDGPPRTIKLVDSTELAGNPGGTDAEDNHDGCEHWSDRLGGRP